MILRQFWFAYVAYIARLDKENWKSWLFRGAVELLIIIVLSVIITSLISLALGTPWSTSTAQLVGLGLIAFEFLMAVIARKSYSRG